MRSLLIVPALLLLGGCAVGRGSMGEVVIGVDAGRLVETGDQALAAAADTILPGLGAVLAPLGIGGMVGGFARAMQKERARKTSDQAREAAERELAVLQALAAAKEAAGA